MKNILFITDTFSNGGLETRILEQIMFLRQKKINSFIICRKFDNPHANLFADISTCLSTYSDETTIRASDIISDVEHISTFCTKHHIDFIDCHPFWCLLPAALAANQLKIPISFTLHGVNSGNFVKDSLPELKTLYSTALSYGFDQIFTVAEYLTKIYPQLSAPIVLHNGLDLNDIQAKPYQNTHQIAIASRFDPTKSQIILDFLPTVYRNQKISKIDIFGDGNSINAIQTFISSNRMEDKVKLRGWTQDLADELCKHNYTAVFGMGRVIIDALKSHTPAGILGYNGFAGFINHRNLIDFSQTNLTSWHQNPDFAKEFAALLKDPTPYLFTKQELATLNSSSIWQKYLDLVQQFSYCPKKPLSKIYHLLAEHPSANLLHDETLFLECVRILSDGERPVDPRVFYAIFQMQFDKINHLSAVHNSSRRSLKKAIKNILR